MKNSTFEGAGISGSVSLARVSLTLLFSSLFFVVGATNSIAAPPKGSVGGASLQSSKSNDRSPIDGMLGANPQLQIEEGLRQRFESGDRIDLVVGFEMPDLSRARRMSWEQRGDWVFEVMQRAVLEHQKPLQSHLDSIGVQYESLRVGNLMLIQQADSSVFQTLANYRSAVRINEQSDFRLIEPELDAGMQTRGGSTPEPNLDQIRATDVWDQLGIRGENIVVGLNDSSPRYTHEVLVNQYRGNNGDGTFDHDYNWFDPTGAASAPVPDFHGSHVLGIMVGDDGVANATGVAPGAEWMACRGCQGQFCSEAAQCLDYFVAPTDRDGNNPNPALRPHVVNNSWGDCSQTYNSAYDPVWDTMYAAGVIPFFANGNADCEGYSVPPGPNTVGNPARSGRVMGIGSSTQTGGDYYPGSNWGPTDDPNPGLPDSFDDFGYPDLKPNVIAPGQGIRSVSSSADDAYTGATGTSMASPHATGVAALMISAAPCLAGDHQTIGSIMMDTAVGIDYDSGVGTEGPGNVPNYAAGWGEIDALAAVQAAQAACGPSGEVSGVVTDSETGQALTNVSVEIPNPAPSGPEDFDTTTNSSGEYSRLLPVGTYDLTFSRFGYVSQTETKAVDEDDEITLDVGLEPADPASISGVVSDAQTGWGLHARLEIEGAPDSPYFTDPVTGAYSINLPETYSTDITVVPLVPGYESQAQPLTVSDGLETDFDLDADASVCTAPGYEAEGLVYSESFASGDGGLSVRVNDGAAALPWEFGTPSSWPGGCNSGSECWGTNLDGNYANSANETLVTPEIDLSGISGDIQFRWAQATHIEDATYDNARAEVSVDGGAWEVMWEHAGATAQIDWQNFSHTISGAGGGTVQFRFTMEADGSVAYNGYYVDDLELIEVDEYACLAPEEGGLLFGQVTDANTGDGLSDAMVNIVGQPAPAIVSTSDPSYENGVFHAFLPVDGETYDILFADRFEEPEVTTSGSGVDVPVSAERSPYTAQSTQVTPVNGQTVGAFLELTAGWLQPQPEAPEVDVTFEQQQTEQMALVNVGTEPLTFQIDGVVTDVVTPVYEQDFESTFPPTDWTIESGTTTDCDWQRNDAWPRDNFAGGDGFSAAADSDLCGLFTSMDSALVTPSFDLTTMDQPGYSFVLSFRDDFGSSQLDLDVSTDGGATWTNLESWDESASAQGPGTPVSGNLLAYADQSDVRLRFHYTSGWEYWAQIDQFKLTDASEWLQVTPENGTFSQGNELASSTAQVLDMYFDASQVPEPGTYGAEILITHDTPYDGGFTSVPVTMNVGLSEGLARLEGEVQGLGYCDSNPISAAGASVEVVGQNSTYSLTADVDGSYGGFIPAVEAPVTIEVSAPDHVSQQRSDVPLASQQTSVEDFGLRLDTPCASVNPQSSSQSLEAGEQISFQAVLENDGAADWNWSEATEQFAGTGPIYIAEDNQTSGFGANHFPNQGDSYVVPSDDFTIDGQSIYRLAIDGFALPGDQTLETVADAFTFAIYADDNGQPAGNPETPGSALFEYTGALDDSAFTVTAPGQLGRIEIDLVEATGDVVNLPDGQYWIAGWATSPTSQAAGPRWIHFNTDEGVRGEIAQIWTTTDGVWTPVDSDLAFEVTAGAVCGEFVGIPAGSGTVASDDVQIVDFELDASGVIPGSYLDLACFEGNDPEGPIVTHDVNLEVTAPATYGTISGQIEGAGYCDADSQTLENAEVVIDGASGPFTVTTDSSGAYSIQVEQGNYTVSASADDHLDESDTVAVSQQVTSTLDLTLRLDAPCANVDPEQFDVTGDTTTSVDETLSIINDGGAELNWNFFGSVPAPTTGLRQSLVNRVAPVSRKLELRDGSVDSHPGLSGNRLANEIESASYEFDDLMPMGGLTLSHSDSLDVISRNTIACGITDQPDTLQNSFYRVFTLSDFGIIGEFEASEVTIGIESIGAAADIEVFLHRLDGALAQANLVEIDSTTVALDGTEETELLTLSLDGVFQPDDSIVVEIAAPSFDGTGNSFYAGSNDQGETAPSYINSFGNCGISEITPFADLNFPEVHLVMTVSGNELLNCAAIDDVSWLSADTTTGAVGADSSTDVTLGFDGNAAGAGISETTICVETDDSENPLVELPITFDVTQTDTLDVSLDGFNPDYHQGEAQSGTEQVEFTYVNETGNIVQIFNVFTIEQNGTEIDAQTYEDLFVLANTSWDDYIRGLSGTTTANVVAPANQTVSINFELEPDAPAGDYTLVIKSYDVTGVNAGDVSLADAQAGVYDVLDQDTHMISVNDLAAPSATFDFLEFDNLQETAESIVGTNVAAENIDPTTPIRWWLRYTDGSDDPIEGQGYIYCIDGQACTSRETLPDTDANGETFFGPESGVPAGDTGMLDPGGATSWFAVTPDPVRRLQRRNPALGRHGHW